MNTIKRWMECLSRKAESRRWRMAGKMARQRLQLMESDGKLWLSVDGVPLLASDQLGGDLMRTLEAMRSNYVIYHARRD